MRWGEGRSDTHQDLKDRYLEDGRVQQMQPEFTTQKHAQVLQYLSLVKRGFFAVVMMEVHADAHLNEEGVGGGRIWGGVEGAGGNGIVCHITHSLV